MCDVPRSGLTMEATLDHLRISMPLNTTGFEAVNCSF